MGTLFYSLLYYSIGIDALAKRTILVASNLSCISMGCASSFCEQGWHTIFSEQGWHTIFMY